MINLLHTTPSFLASRFHLPLQFFGRRISQFSTVQEQPPGYNMVRVDVANMEQAQEAEGAQARSVIKQYSFNHTSI